MTLRAAFVLTSGRLAVTGGEKNVVRLLQALPNGGVETCAIARAGPIVAMLEERGIEVAVLPRWRTPPTWARYHAARAFRFARALASGAELGTLSRIVDELERVPWIVERARGRSEAGKLLEEHLGLRVSWPFAERLLVARHALRIRKAVTSLGADRCIVGLPWDGAAAVAGLHPLGIPVVWYVQSSRSPRFGDELLRRHASRIITCGAGVGRVRIGDSRSYIAVPNGIPVGEFHAKAPGEARPACLRGVPAEACLIGAASLSRSKGTGELLQAMIPLLRARPDLHLVLLGGASQRYRRRLRRTTDRSEVSGQVHLPGHVEPVAPVLRQLTVFVLPSRSEGLPLALCEAMASTVASVAYDIPGCREVGGDGSVALVPEGDVDGLRAAVLRLLDDPEGRRGIAGRGRARVLGQFTLERMIAAFRAALLKGA